MVVHSMPYKIIASGLSDIGLVRHNNEDSWAELPQCNFFVLADGMGGHKAGEVASKEAVNGLCKIILNVTGSDKEELSFDEMHGVLQFAIEYVNDLIYAMGSTKQDLHGMGTTLCCLYFHPEGLIYAHVGDSRIYRLRNGILEQLTKDDSLLREILESEGHNSDLKSQHHDHLYKNIITKAIGTESVVEPAVHLADLLNSDIYLMCSDGLSDMLSLQEIELILLRYPDLQKCTEHLIAAAIERGGLDNITVVLTKVQDHKDDA